MHKELESLNRLARETAAGLPIDTSVSYDARVVRVTLVCRSTRAPKKQYGTLTRSWSPTVVESGNLAEFVRDHVEEFVHLWIRSGDRNA